jgi:hypothetical protein
MARVVVSLVLVSLIVAVASVAAEQTVNLKNGGKLTGEVRKTAKGYEVKMRTGGVVTLLAEDVASITDAAAAQSEYEKRLAALDKNDPKAQVEMAEWAESQGMLQAAREHLQAAVALDKSNEKAQLLLRRVEAKLQATATASAPAATATATGPATVVSHAGKDVVGQEDIYRIRLAEYRPGEQATFTLRNKLIDRFVQSMRGRDKFEDPDYAQTFRSQPAIRQVEYILDQTAPGDAIRNDILITSDPAFMVEFRQVWPVVQNSCASIRCHGADKGAGGLKLIPGSAGNAANDYTNFLILSAFESGGRKLIDRSQPGDSLLLQYGLPDSAATAAHPRKLPTPPFPNQSDPKYKRLSAWIESLKGPSQPRYNLEYKPPAYLKLNLAGSTASFLDRPGTASKPAAKPSTAPASPF